jgi:hypothetical protein
MTKLTETHFQYIGVCVERGWRGVKAQHHLRLFTPVYFDYKATSETGMH